jgi:hypothetical protein
MTESCLPFGVELLKSGAMADLTVTCKGNEFRVHKVIVAQRSGFLRACMEDKSMVSQHPHTPFALAVLLTEEGQKSTIDLAEEEPYYVALALWSAYNSQLLLSDFKLLPGPVQTIWPIINVPGKPFESIESTLKDFAKLALLANRLVMPQLALEAKSLLSHLAYHEFDVSSWEPTVAPPTRLLQLLKVIHEYLADDDQLLLSAIVRAHDFCYYPNTHTDLQAQLKAFVNEHYPRLWEMVSVCRQSDYRKHYRNTFAAVEPRDVVGEGWGAVDNNDGWGKMDNNDGWANVRAADQHYPRPGFYAPGPGPGPASGHPEDYNEWQMEDADDYKRPPGW